MNTTVQPTAAPAALVPRRLLTDDLQSVPRLRHGVILFADIAGFTRLTENAHRNEGTRGVEQLTGYINQVLSDLVDAALSAAGDVLKFGGDAILVAFDADGDDHASVLSALHAASLMRDSITQHRRGPLRSVSLHLGLAFGEWHEMIAGSSGVRREHFVWGEAVTSAMSAADGDHSMPRLCCPAQLLPVNVRRQFTRVARGTYDFAPARRGQHPHAILTNPTSHAVGDLASLWDFLPVELRNPEMINGFNPARSAEHRRVATVFGFWKAPKDIDDPEKCATLLDAITDLVHSASQSSAGLWVRSDPSGDRQKLLVLFGAITSATDDVDRSLQFAEALHDGFLALREAFPSLRLSAGVATATVFTGVVGNVRRREFTAMGEGVNLAARLAAKAPNHATLCDQYTLNEASHFQFVPAGTLQLKNVRKPTPVFSPTAFVEHDSEDFKRATVEHPGAMRECLRFWSNGQRYIAVAVDPGADSHRFMGHFRERIGVEPDDVEVIEFSPIDESVPGQAIGRLLEKLRPGHSLPDMLGGERVARLISRLGPEAAARELTRDVGALTSHRTLVVLEHFERVAGLDRSVIVETLSRSRARVVAVEHVRPHLSEASISGECLRLGAVTREELAEVFSELLSPAVSSRGLVELLHKRSQGAPKVACALLRHLVSRGLATRTRGKRPVWLLRNADAIDIPNGLRALYLQKIDRLTGERRSVLRAIAVLGDAATIPGIRALCEALAADVLSQCLTSLANEGLVESRKVDSEDQIAIADPTCRQAVYETMSYHLRDEYHLRAALISRSTRRPDPAQIGEHLYRAREAESGRWLEQAARKARRHWSLGRARMFLRWALLARQGLFKPDFPAVCPPFPDHPTGRDLKLFEALAETLRLEGHYKDASRIHAWISRISRHAGRLELSCHHQLMSARLDWYSGHYVKSGRQAKAIFKMARRLKSTSLAAQAAFLLGETCRRTGRVDASLNALLEACSLAEAIGDRTILADALNALGLLHWNCGRLSDARNCFVRALQLFGKGGDPTRRGQVANNLGILHEELGQLPQAQRYYERAFKVFERTGIRRHRAYSLGNLANLHRHAARYERARSAYEEVDSELRTMGEAHAAAYTVGNLGDLVRDFGDLPTARELYDRTLHFAVKAHDEELRAECLARIAHVHLLESRHDSAHRLIRRALRSARAARSREFVLCAQLLAIESELDRKPASALLKRIKAIMDDATQLGLLYYQLWTVYTVARIEKRLGDKASSQSRVAAGMAKAHRSGYAWWELRLAVEGMDALYTRNFRTRCSRRAIELRNDFLAGIGDPAVRLRFAELPLIRAISTYENDLASRVDLTSEPSKTA